LSQRRTIEKMISKNNKYANITLVAVLALIVSMLPGQAAQAATYKKITFTTTSELVVVPDQVIVYFNIQTQANTLKLATSNLAEKSKTLKALLGEKKIPLNLLQSYNLSSYPQYNPSLLESGTQEIIGYNISQSFSLKLNNISASGEVISFLTDNLGDELSISNTSLQVSSPTKYESKLLTTAVSKAKSRAYSYMKEFKGSNLKLVSLKEGMVSNYYPTGRNTISSDSAPSISIEPGTQTLTLTITTVWSFK
jgi:uncharacterized protein YggE